MSRRPRSRARGTTLIEILISVAVVLVGMLALFRTLGSSLVGSSTASKLTQAQQRAVTVMENIRIAPRPALECLRGPVTGWSTCETTCRANLAAASADSCIYSSLSIPGTHQQAGTDRNLQNYFVVGDSNPSGGVSSVTVKGTTGRVYDVQVVIGWRDDNDPTKTVPDHSVAVRSGVFE
jgi:Tfp pilus assembly protein PilV